PERDRGWEVKGPDGLETALLLVRRTPLPVEVHLPDLIGKLPKAPLRDLHEVAVRGFDSDQPTEFVNMAQNRGLDAVAKQTDERLLQLMEHLRPHFEMIRAVRFAHKK